MCLPSFTSQSIVVPSLPPLAQSEPSGEMVTSYSGPPWPARLKRSLQLFKFHTFTSLSHPQLTMSGCFADGLKRTLDTQSECASSVIVYLHSASVFQRRIDLSRDPETIWRLSDENATEFTSDVWPAKLRTDEPVFRSQRRIVLSQLAVSANWPSELVTRSWIGWLWPVSFFFATPGCSSFGVRSHTITLLSRLPERRMLGFSKEVAREVTQPRWPSSDPRRTSCSDIVCVTILGTRTTQKALEPK